MIYYKLNISFKFTKAILLILKCIFNLTTIVSNLVSIVSDDIKHCNANCDNNNSVLALMATRQVNRSSNTSNLS